MSTLLEALSRGETLILGHRGASAYAPMNTLPAFVLAAEQGADGIELDVHRSKDGYGVVIHDFTVDHTTDGTGRVDSMTLAELKALDAGAWFGESFIGTRIPTLAEVLEAVGQRLYINVEIKSESEETDGVEQVVADVIAQYTMQDRVIVSSFNPLALQRFRAIMPDVPVGFLYARVMPVDTEELMRSLNLRHEARHPHHEMVDAAYMAWARREGYAVNTWTVNDSQRAQELRDLGVNAIITDAPDVLLKALRDS